MNLELGLKSIVRRKKPGYAHGKPHKISENRLKQDFHAESINQKWCTDFTYLFLKNGDIRYNCSIIDLYDRSIVASIIDRRITGDLAIRTLQKALESQPAVKGELILHSDQGTQYTSKAFIDYCESVHVTQSMSKASYPYDNAPMERYWLSLIKSAFSGGKMDISLYSNKMDEYLKHDSVIDYDNKAIIELVDMIFKKADNELDFIRTAYEFVRDNISHSADINVDIITCAASEVLKAGHGICFAKSHLLAALLRCKAIPTGFCCQKLILDDEAAPVLIYHGLNGVYIKDYKK